MAQQYYHIKEYEILDVSSLATAENSEKIARFSYPLSSVQAKWTAGSAAGTFKLQANNDPDNYSWEDIPSASQDLTTASSKIMSLSDLGYKYIRAVFDVTSGTLTSGQAMFFGAGAD